MYSGNNITITCNREGIAELIFDVQDSAVNIFTAQTIVELEQALLVLEQEKSIKGLLLCSAKSAFFAGADINSFSPAFVQGPDKVAALLYKTNNHFNRIETLPYPVIAVINGFALGGGCEIALACDYRVIAQDAKIGLPETTLGIIPGWGGTVRLPRLSGVETAIEWIATGRKNKAIDALKVGAVDAVIDTRADPALLKNAALSMLHQCINGQLNYQQRREQKQLPLQHNDVELTMALMTSKAMVAAQAGKHYLAPLAAVNAIEKSARLSSNDALQVESDTFVSLSQSAVTLSLLGLFVGDQFIARKAKKLAQTASKKINKAAVLGAGIMGGGIAYQSALKHIPIVMKDIHQAGLDIGLSEANTLLGKQVSRGRLSVTDMGQVLNRITPTLSNDSLDNVDIVVEAVVENPKIKATVLAEVERHVAADTIITSNTSTISIDTLATSLQRPENFCGMHFFNPVQAMPLVEVIRGAKTSDNAIATTVAYANALGKKAIVVGNCPGFLVNRVLFAYLAGFSLLLKEGVDFSDVDQVMEAWGWPMGPAYLFDVVGIDTCIHAEGIMVQGFPKRMQRDFISAAQALFDAGHFGQKTGQGFYHYEKDKKGRWVKNNSPDSQALIAPHIAPSPAKGLTKDEMVFRMMVPMATELARCLQEGIVASPEEADMALVYGLGFPPFKGGIFRWLDTLGLEDFCQAASQFAHLGQLYQPPEDMLTLKDSGNTYYNFGDVNQEVQ